MPASWLDPHSIWEHASMESWPAESIVAWAVETFGPHLTVASSFGAEDMVLIDLIACHKPPPEVFYLDTGLFFPETYALIEDAARHYQLQPLRVAPALTLAEQAKAFGPALWEKDPDRCCSLRKVEPLRRHLAGKSAWMTGIRRQQAPTRARARVLEWDARFQLWKVNPLVYWTTEEVWTYLREHQVPHNPLHHQGYPSIGCMPCTTAVQAGEDLRAGRWRGQVKTECGLHQ